MPDPNGKSVLCVSWNPSLARTREELLAQVGYRVISALGEAGAASVCRENADLLVLGHSVREKRNEQLSNLFASIAKRRFSPC
jgi:hypothetical protein